MASHHKRLTIGALARMTGVNIETVRYYERIGLVPSPPRSEGRHRLFDDTHGRRLIFIRRGRECLFSLGAIEYSCVCPAYAEGMQLKSVIKFFSCCRAGEVHSARNQSSLLRSRRHSVGLKSVFHL